MRGDSYLDGTSPFSDNFVQSDFEQFIRFQWSRSQYHAVIKIVYGAAKKN